MSPTTVLGDTVAVAYRGRWSFPPILGYLDEGDIFLAIGCEHQSRSCTWASTYQPPPTIPARPWKGSTGSVHMVIVYTAGHPYFSYVNYTRLVYATRCAIDSKDTII